MAHLLPFESPRRRENQPVPDHAKLQALIASLQFLSIASPRYFDVVAQVVRELVERI